MTDRLENSMAILPVKVKPLYKGEFNTNDLCMLLVQVSKIVELFEV